MKIINYTTRRTSKIKELILKLPKEYHDIDIPINIYPDNIIGNILNYKLEDNLGFNNSIKDAFKDFNKVGGVAYYSISTQEPVCIKIKNHSCAFEFILFHEIRHWYQQKYLKAFHMKFDSPCKLKFPRYNYEPLERDANNFAKRYCKKLRIKFKANSYEIL